MADVAAAKLMLPVGERDHMQGSADAPVTLVEYGDYQCPYCRQVMPIVRDLQERFGDRFRYVFRHFPVTPAHLHARLAAEAAEAAGAQGKFWEMHFLLFKHEGMLDKVDLVRYAKGLGLDIERFERELAEHTHAAHVREDFDSGVRSGISGTPAFFLNGERYDGPWDLDSLAAEIQKPVGVRVRLIYRQFARIQASGGILLLLATVLAMVWANSPWSDSYFSLWDTYLSLSLGGLVLKENLLHWVNDGLMVIFFFLVGLEIKREVLVGELASLKRAALPLMGGLGGMVLPALIYALVNAGGEGQPGWGIPMATDIAFMLGLLALMGSRVSISLKVFFTALAIADDLGAVLVIALFYSGEIQVFALAAALVILALLIGLNRLGVRRPMPYVLLGIGLWLAFLQSGLHPTIAGVLLAMTIPARVRSEGEAYVAQCTAALGGLGESGVQGDDRRQQAAAQTLETIAERIQSPLQRLERALNPWVAYLILPVFAFANAGVSIGGDLGGALTHPVAVGIIAGLVLGKPLGITLLSWIAVRIKLAELPVGVTWKQLFAASWLAGIGFTMSLFIASSAFDAALLLNVSKVGILGASLLASAAGFGLLSVTSPARGGHSMLEEAATAA